MSTHRKLNAFRSKWASQESFGTTFKKALDNEVCNNDKLREGLPDNSQSLLERFQSTLDKSKQYMFLIRNTSSNRIVCEEPSNNKIYHVGTFVDGTFEMVEDIGIPKPQVHKFTNIQELCTYVEHIDIKNLQGVIIFTPWNKQYKILNSEYQVLFNARGNEPSIKFRYLQVRMDEELTNMLYYLYPEMEPMFTKYENAIYNISVDIYNAYIRRFIKKEYVTLPREEFGVLRECHAWHIENRNENRINFNKVMYVMNNQTPTNLNRMIRHYLLEKEKTKKETGGDELTALESTVTRLLSKNKDDLPVSCA